MNPKKRLTRFEWHLHRLLMLLILWLGRIPRSLARKFGDFLGDAGFLLDRQHRQVSLNNIELALGKELDPVQQWCIARAAYRNLGQILFEVGWSMNTSARMLEKHITIDGLEHYHRALAKGKGVLVLTAHIGNWELMPFLAHQARTPVNVVYRRLDFRPVNLVFEKIRSRFGARLIPSRFALLKIFKALKKGEAVAMLMDQNVDYYDGVWVDFFDEPACTSKAMAIIARKTGAPVLPIFLYREDHGFRVVVEPALQPEPIGDLTKDIETRTAQYTRAIEVAVRRHPGQWFWVHRRWKTMSYCPWPRLQG